MSTDTLAPEPVPPDAPDWRDELPEVGRSWGGTRVVSLAGQEWQSENHARYLFQVVDRDALPFGVFRVLRINRFGCGHFGWESSLAVIEGAWYSRAIGAADTAEAAAAAALVYRHEAIEVDGVRWHKGENVAKSDEEWTAYFGQRRATVKRFGDDLPDHYSWSREADLALFEFAGIESLASRELRGKTTAGRNAAMQLSTHCLHTLRQALLRFVDEELRIASGPLPSGLE